jgi:type III secretion protein C
MTKNIRILIKAAQGSSRPCRISAAAAALAIFLILNPQPAQSLAPKWPEGPYQYLVVDQDIRDILTEFGRNLNINVKISDQVGGRRIRGRLPITTAEQFLKRLCESYGLVWYYDGAVLHINSESELRTELVELGPISPFGVNEKLQALGITDPRYAIRSTADSRVLSVSGPPPYIAMIRQTVAAMQKAASPKSVREVQDGDEVRVKVFRGRREGS